MTNRRKNHPVSASHPMSATLLPHLPRVINVMVLDKLKDVLNFVVLAERFGYARNRTGSFSFDPLTEKYNNAWT
jgi:hypothetical protein